MKDEEKQTEEIEKMAYSICGMGTVSEYITDCDKCGYYHDCLRLAFAQRFYNAGYCKQSDTAREILKKVGNISDGDGFSCLKDYAWFARLCEQYGVKREDL